MLGQTLSTRVQMVWWRSWGPEKVGFTGVFKFGKWQTVPLALDLVTTWHIQLPRQFGAAFVLHLARPLVQGSRKVSIQRSCFTFRLFNLAFGFALYSSEVRIRYSGSSRSTVRPWGSFQDFLSPKNGKGVLWRLDRLFSFQFTTIWRSTCMRWQRFFNFWGWSQIPTKFLAIFVNSSAFFARWGVMKFYADRNKNWNKSFPGKLNNA